jgi:hypothetical protein
VLRLRSMVGGVRRKGFAHEIAKCSVEFNQRIIKATSAFMSFVDLMIRWRHTHRPILKPGSAGASA